MSIVRGNLKTGFCHPPSRRQPPAVLTSAEQERRLIQAIAVNHGEKKAFCQPPLKCQPVDDLRERFAPDWVIRQRVFRSPGFSHQLREKRAFEISDCHGQPSNTAAPSGVAQISSVPLGNLISRESPHTSSKRVLYAADCSRNAMQAVSGKPISPGSTGGCCACSASGLCSKYPVARASQKKASFTLLWHEGCSNEIGTRWQESSIVGLSCTISVALEMAG